MSRNKWRRIFREFDRNGDDDISTEEMLHFLFDSVAPEHEANKLHLVCMFVYYSEGTDCSVLTALVVLYCCAVLQAKEFVERVKSKIPGRGERYSSRGVSARVMDIEGGPGSRELGGRGVVTLPAGLLLPHKTILPPLDRGPMMSAKVTPFEEEEPDN